MSHLEVGSLRHRQDVAREVWGKTHQFTPTFPNLELLGDQSGDNPHPHLQGLYRVTRHVHLGDKKDTTDSVRLTQHHFDPEMGGHLKLSGFHTPIIGQGHEHKEVWDELAHSAYAHKRPPISDKVRALIHQPHIAADAMEEEGHDKLAHMLRNAEHVDTHYGRDANYPDVMFVHNNRPHLLVRSNEQPLKRYHFVGPPLK